MGAGYWQGGGHVKNFKFFFNLDFKLIKFIYLTWQLDFKLIKFIYLTWLLDFKLIKFIYFCLSVVGAPKNTGR